MHNMYLVPAGAVIGGQALSAPAYLPPTHVTINGFEHGPEIFALWTDEGLAELGIKRVVADALPVDGNGWAYLPGEPEDIEEALQVRRTWPNAVPDTEGWAAHLEAKATLVRAERAARLTACDWTQLPDAPLTTEQRSAWAAYRQALRNVPEQAGFPQVVEWPAKPE